MEDYPALCQHTDEMGSPNIKVWDQDPYIVRDLFWSSPVHTVIERKSLTLARKLFLPFADRHAGRHSLQLAFFYFFPH